MPHPWDLHWTWLYSTNEVCPQLASILQLQCLAKGLFGVECASYAQQKLDWLADLVARSRW